MGDYYKVVTEEIPGFSEADLHSANERMFSVKENGDEDHHDSIVSWRGENEDLKRMGCTGMTIRNISNNRGNFFVQTWDRNEYACRIHAMHDDAAGVLPAEHCIRFISSDMSRPTTIFINVPGIEWGLFHSSSRRLWQQKAFKVCYEHLEMLKKGEDPGIPRRSFWRRDSFFRFSKSLARKGIKAGIENAIG